MRLQVLFSEVERMGGDINDVIKKAGNKYAARFNDPEDALFMAQNAADDLRKLFGHAEQGNAFELRALPAPDLTPEQVTKLAAEPATDSAVLHNLEHIMAEKPDAEFTTQQRQADGSYQLVTRKLSDVLAEIDGLEAAGRELEACAVGLAAAAE
jgi:hypothetical protein